MSVPCIDNSGDRDVPVRCPSCGVKSKRYLIDATHYHQMAAECRFLFAMKAITDRYPGTTHPLLAGKLPKPWSGFTDEHAVGSLLARQPELCQFLR